MNGAMIEKKKKKKSARTLSSSYNVFFLLTYFLLSMHINKLKVSSKSKKGYTV